MRLLRRARNVTRHARWRVLGFLERAKLGRHLDAAYTDAMPTTSAGEAGREALFGVVEKTLDALDCDRVFRIGLDQAGGKRLSGPGPVLRNGLIIESSAEKAASLISSYAETKQDDARYAIVIDQGDGFHLMSTIRVALSRCDLVYLPVQGRIVEMIDLLMSLGFEPIAKDSRIKNEPFHVLFVRKELLETRLLGPLTVWVHKTVDPMPVCPVRAISTPVLVPCFNNQTYCRSMVAQLKSFGFENITLLDNASTSTEMHNFLDEIEDTVCVHRLKENMGPKRCFVTPEVFDNLPRFFCVTDPDIVFNPFLPADFVEQMIALMSKFNTAKAGLALDISHRQFFRDLSVTLLYQEWKSWEWEERFWSQPIGVTRSNDKVFLADVDTTFAVYDKSRWSPNNFTAAIRVGGRFTATHAPWYERSDIQTDEQEKYLREGLFSYYKM